MRTGSLGGRVLRAALWLLVLGASCRLAEVSPEKLVDRASMLAVATFVRDMFPPDRSPAFLLTVAVAIARTLAVAVAGTALSILIGLPLGYLATPTLFRRGVLVDGEPRSFTWAAGASLSMAVRGLLRVLRAIPDVIWAVVFVVAIGLGPLAGALALGVSYAGVLGRVYADVFEATDPGPIEALHAAGATRFGAFVFAIWPQALRATVAYTLYSFECCVRAASVLGFIGAGGLGYELNVSMRLFEYGQVTTLLVAYLVLVFAAEVLSRALRGRYTTIARALARAGSARFAAWSSALAAVAVSFIGIGVWEADASGGLGRVLRFARSLFPPDTSLSFLRTLALPLVQTVAIGVVGTVIGAVGGAVLIAPSVLSSIAHQGGDRPTVGWVLGGVGRAALAVLRSIPEMLWVLLCIVAIGLGPFTGTLAVGFHTAGVLGKLYGDALEEVPPGPVAALHAAGANVSGRLLWAVLPQAWSTLASYTLLRFEANLRAATVVGLVGGGGIGLVLYNDIQLGFYDRVGTLILVVYGLVAWSDWLSSRLRRTSFARSLARVSDAAATALLATSDAPPGRSFAP
jgi:phosphonate transport system permease protein